MYKPNKKHLQPPLISNINDLPRKHRERLEKSWAGVFYDKLFCLIKEDVFAVLYADQPSRPNTPINVLVGLEVMKSGFGWSDEELYDHFLFDIQIRYALGYRDLKEGSFELRTLYNFRQRLSEYYQGHGINLMAAAFEGITEQQMAALEVMGHIQRMDSTQIASNMMVMTRLQLLLEGLQRMWRVLNEAEREVYQEWLDEYIKSGSGQFVYRVKGKEEAIEHTRKVGEIIHRLLVETKADYEDSSAYQLLERLFQENFNLIEEAVHIKPNDQISSGCLQSVDDLEATYRRKGSKVYKGYVANVTQTCVEENPLQLITKVQVAPNNVEDAALLAEATPDLKERTGVEILHVDGVYNSITTDEVLNEHQIELVQSGIRGVASKTGNLNLSVFDFITTEKGKPIAITCPNSQTVDVKSGRKSGYVAQFDPTICKSCPLIERCQAKPNKRDPRYKLHFYQRQVNTARRRKRAEIRRQSGKNPRAGVEAAVWSIKSPFRAGKLPVRGLFRVSCLIVSSAAMSNIRAICRYKTKKMENEHPDSPLDISLFLDFSQFIRCFAIPASCFSF